MPRLAAGLQCSWKQYDQDKYTDGTVPSKRRGGQRMEAAPGRPFISWFSCDIVGCRTRLAGPARMTTARLCLGRATAMFAPAV